MFLFLFVSCKTTSQNHSHVHNKANYYEAIQTIMLENSKFSVLQEKLFNNYIETGKYTKEQIEHYKKQSKSRNLYLHHKQSNKMFLYFLEKKEMQKYFTQYELSKAKNALDTEEFLEEDYLKNEIRLFNEGYGHYFSTPVYLNNRMIIFHSFNPSKYLANKEIHIYNLGRNKKIEGKNIIYLEY